MEVGKVGFMLRTRETRKGLNAQAYVDANSYRINPQSRHLRCIDDRERRRPDTSQPLPEVAVPGAGLGLLLDFVAAARRAAFEYELLNKPVFTPAHAFEVVEKHLGHLSLHTDTVNTGHSALACAGCGYCALSLDTKHEQCVNSGLEVQDVLVVEELLPAVVARCQLAGDHVMVYEGPHAADGILIIDDPTIGMPSTNFDGTQVFVYHQANRLALLATLADKLYPSVQRRCDRISPTHWGEMVTRVAHARTKHALQKLAAGLPRFSITRDGDKRCIAKQI